MSSIKLIVTIMIVILLFPLGGVILKGHHKVGDNTAPNVYAALRGKLIFGDLKSIVLKGLDGMEFIFDEYAKKG